MDELDTCDYCNETLPTYFTMRAVGFDDGKVLVKTWCGECETPDDIDAAAEAKFLDSFMGTKGI